MTRRTTASEKKKKGTGNVTREKAKKKIDDNVSKIEDLLPYRLYKELSHRKVIKELHSQLSERDTLSKGDDLYLVIVAELIVQTMKAIFDTDIDPLLKFKYAGELRSHLRELGLTPRSRQEVAPVSKASEDKSAVALFHDAG